MTSLAWETAATVPTSVRQRVGLVDSVVQLLMAAGAPIAVASDGGVATSKPHDVLPRAVARAAATRRRRRRILACCHVRRSDDARRRQSQGSNRRRLRRGPTRRARESTGRPQRALGGGVRVPRWSANVDRMTRSSPGASRRPRYQHRTCHSLPACPGTALLGRVP